MQIPAQSSRFFINTSQMRHWHDPVKRYIDDCTKGIEGPLGKDYDLRWSAGAVADVYRVLPAGGVYLNPSTELLSSKGLAGKQVNPLSFLVQQAGEVTGFCWIFSRILSTSVVQYFLVHAMKYTPCLTITCPERLRAL